jgi:hypothetical protein
MKIGDKITIIENEKHVPNVKKHYGKVLEIQDIRFSTENKPLYKIRGIGNYALETDIQLYPKIIN